MHEWQVRDRVLTIDRRPLVMGIVNVTPDSFSDGGRFAAVEAAVAHGLELVSQGADILDVGGESTRPGAMPVPLEEELRRVVPVMEELAKQITVPLSIDTSKAAVAKACIERGASIINDVTALRGDADMPEVARRSRAGLVLMHMQGTPQTMQHAPHYDNVVEDIGRFFEERLASLEAVGVERQCTALDPGIGFGKTTAHNLDLLTHLDAFVRLGRPICLGLSRKGFIGRMLEQRPVERRLAGSLGGMLFAASIDAVQIVRVHDAEQTRDALTVFTTLQERRMKDEG